MLTQLPQPEPSVSDELNRQLAAVMFTDMAGYTALMQKDEAAALRSRQRHRSALEQCLSGRKGEVLQYFGDGSLSIFSSSVQAVEAAIDIQRRLHGDPTLRIGLHSGDIAYDVQGAYGDAVNIAARLEAICPPGGITISQKIYDDIRRHPTLPAVPSGTVRLKNVQDVVPTYAVSADGLTLPTDDLRTRNRLDDGDLAPELVDRLEELARRVHDPLQRIASIPGRVPLVGRDREVDELRGLLETAEGHAGSTIFLRGPRGVGKTRLTQEVAAHARSRGWTALIGRAHPSERLVPYAPFSDALMPLLRGLDMRTLAGLTPGNDATLCALFPALGRAPQGPDLSMAGPGESRTRLYWQFASMLSRLAEHRPLLIALEDLDFADRASLELFEFVARQSREEPILFIGEYTGADPERRQTLLRLEQSLITSGSARVFELAPLDQSGAAEFIREAFELEAEEASDLAEVVFGWSHGNPFFMTGSLRGLVEGGALQKEDGHWKTMDLESIELPHSVRDAVLVWMGQLSQPSLEVARFLAIVGKEAPYDVIRHLCELEDGVLADALDELVRHQLITESEDRWTLSYAFRNPMIREALKSELPLATRRELHTRMGHSLETFYGDNADAHADELAYHFGRAQPHVVGARAVYYLMVAGEAALRRHANREAAAYLQEALDRADSAPPGSALDSPQEALPVPRLLKGLARARRRLGDVPAAVAIWRRLLASARDRHASNEVPGLHREIGLTLMAGGDLEKAIEEFSVAAEEASGAGNVPLVVQAQLAQTQCYQACGMAKEAGAVVANAMNLATQLGNPGLLAQVHRSFTQLKIWTGDIEEARGAAATSTALAREAGDRGAEFWSRWAMAAMEGLFGKTETMANHVAEARTIADEVGSPLFDLATKELALELAYARGDWDEAIEMGHRAIELARSTDRRFVLPRLLVWVSLMHLGRNEWDVADQLTWEAWEVSGAAKATNRSGFMDLHAVVPAHIGRASYALARGDWSEAVRIAEAGLEIADRSGYTVWSIHHILPIIAEASIHARDLERASTIGARMRAEAERMNHPLGLAWADACDAILTWLQGDAEVGAASLRAGAEAMESIPMAYEAARLRRQLAGRLAEIGDVDAAVTELRRSYRVFDQLGARGEMMKVEGQFAELGMDMPPFDITA